MENVTGKRNSTIAIIDKDTFIQSMNLNYELEPNYEPKIHFSDLYWSTSQEDSRNARLPMELWDNDRHKL